MLETSTDLLKVVLAASIGVFTIFLCWGLFYIIMTARNILVITRDARKIFDKIESILDAIKDKINTSASYLMIIGEVLKKIFEFMNRSEGKFKFPKFGRKKTTQADKDSDRKKPKDDNRRRSKKNEKDSEDDLGDYEFKEDEDTW